MSRDEIGCSLDEKCDECWNPHCPDSLGYDYDCYEDDPPEEEYYDDDLFWHECYFGEYEYE
jgi:hypothetical protein